MKSFAILLALALPAFALGTPGSTNNKADQSALPAVRVDRALELSGGLTDPLWQRAIPVELGMEIQPGENTPAPVKTRVYALFDEEHLYLGFRCDDPTPSSIRANLSDRDRIFSDDFVLVVIDTYGDYQRGYELAVNPYGIQGDLMMSSGGEDPSFDMIWKSAGSINGSGWTAEMAIPFKSLRFPDLEEHEWGINIVRNYPRDTRTMTSWTPVDRNVPNFMAQGGRLIGLTGISPSGSFEALPYFLGQQAGALQSSDGSSRFTNGPLQGRVGAGLRYSPSSDISVDLVLNPDFSQVESDADQISVNTTFALYYEERRPFFLESSELLQTPMYYSRSINNPIGAARIVGKSGGLSYMVLSASDRNSVFVVPGEEQSSTVRTGTTSWANIGRLRYDLEDESYIGLMGFGRNFSGGHNYVAGFDWNYKFWGNWYFNGEGFLSRTQELSDPTLLSSDRTLGSTSHTAALDGESYTGSGIHLVLQQSGRDFGFTTVYNDFSPTFQTYNGLFSSNNFRQFYLSPRYDLYLTGPVLERVQFSLGTDVRINYEGQEKMRMVQPSVYLGFTHQTSLSVGYYLVSDELFRGIQFRNMRRTRFNLNSRAWDALSFGAYGQIGSFIYRSSTPEAGTGHSLGASVTVRPSSQLKVDLSYDRAQLRSTLTDQLFYDGYVGRTVVTYQFTPEVSLRTIAQYNSFGKEFNVYPLFSYKLNALTTFYAGMTNRFLESDASPTFQSSERQFFVKMQYLFRS